MGAPLLDTAEEEALIPLSALQHYLFCPRQCALIHIERLWAEDVATAEGRLLHERADSGGRENRSGQRVARGMTLRSRALGVFGKADVVEFRREGGRESPYPVEYKRGRPKAHRADEVQLCAQALCLEEMFDIVIAEGALFYGQTRRRKAVALDAGLRALTTRVAAQTRAMIAAGRTPAPMMHKGCAHCSLLDLCRPASLQRPPRVADWLARRLAE